LGEILYGLRYPLQKRADFLGFRGGEISDMEAVTEGLDDQGPYSQGSRAMLDHPMLRGVDPPAGKWFDAFYKPASMAI